jgi:hypothetical protein
LQRQTTFVSSLYLYNTQMEPTRSEDAPVDPAFLQKAITKAVAYQTAASVDKAKLQVLRDSYSESERKDVERDREAIAELARTEAKEDLKEVKE